MFQHMLFMTINKTHEHYNHLVSPILGKLDFNFLIRAKLNCYTKKEKFIYTDLHTDFGDPHYVALFSLNTCNGFTYFEDTKEKVPSILKIKYVYSMVREDTDECSTDRH